MIAARNAVRLVGLATLAGVLAACAATGPAVAQSPSEIPVLVMGEDGDPASVSRRSNIHKRVLAALKESVQRDGYRMIDEEMIAVDLGWAIVERRPKTQLIEAAKLANTSTNATHRVRAMMNFSIFATRERTSFAQRVNTRIEGEIYDVPNNRFLGAFELPRESYSAPADCNDRCLTEIVGDRARDIASNLGAELRKKLSLLAADGAPAGATAAAAASSATALVHSYTVTFANFAQLEVQEITRVMREEFPGARQLEAMQAGSAQRRFAYQSASAIGQLNDWFAIQLRDMGFNFEREIAYNTRGQEILIDKLVNRDARPRGQQAPRFR